MIIDKGRIVADGSTEELKKSTGEEMIINMTLLKADFELACRMIGSVDGVSSVERIESENPEEIRLKITASGSELLRDNIYAVIKETNWILVELSQETKSLENIFRELTKEA